MAKFEILEDKRVKFELTISAENFEKGVEAAYVKNGKKYSLPGFRKGKAPRKMLERAYGKEMFYMDAIDELYWDVYMEAVGESGFIPVDYPELEIIKLEADQDVVLGASVAVKPTLEITDEQYKGIEVVKAEFNVTDEMVERDIAREREKTARWIEVDRAIENGDRITLDYSGSVDGVKFEGGTAEGQTLDIGSGHFIPGFEEQLVGVIKDETQDITVTFPEEYHATELAGKEAVFTVTVHEIKTKELSELDDEFAKDVSEFDTFEEYRADVKAKLTEQAKERAEQQTQNNAVDALVARIDMDVPSAMIDRYVSQTLRDLEMRLKYQGITLDDYITYSGTTMDGIKNDMRPEAKKRVIADLALEAIIKKENIEASDEEISAEIARIAGQMGRTVEEVEKMVGDAEKAGIKTDVMNKKAVEIIVGSAVLVDAPKPEQKEND